MSAAPFCVIIPAHNEESVIERCLQAIYAGAPANARPEVIVSANGCRDRTVAIARAVAPDAIVLDLPKGSKTGAINAANQAASHFPRIILDADCECSYSSLAALAAALREPGVMTAAPAIQMELSRCSALMKAYYRAWLRQPYAKAGKGGAGCYGLSEDALAKIGQFPPIIGDDIWIHTRFPDEAMRYIAEDSNGRPVFSVVRPPRTVQEQIRIEARRQSGNAEVGQIYPSQHFVNTNQRGGWSKALRSGAAPSDLAVFFAIKLASRVFARWNRVRGKASVWARDNSARAT